MNLAYKDLGKWHSCKYRNLKLHISSKKIFPEMTAQFGIVNCHTVTWKNPDGLSLISCIYCWCVIFLCFYGCPKDSHDSCLDCTCNKVKGGMIMHCVVVPKSCVCQYLSVFLNVSVSYLLTFLSKRCSRLIVIYECHLYALFTT